MADTAIVIPVGSLSLSEETVKFANSGDMKLVFSSDAPATLTAFTIPVGTGSISYSGQTVIRAYGLQFLSDAISLKIDRFRDPNIGSISFSSDVVTPLITIPASSHVVGPSHVALGFSGNVPVANLKRIIFPTIGSMSFSSSAPTIAVGKSLFIFRSAITVIQSDAPTVSIDYVGGSPGDGTIIENLQAGPEASNYEICDRSGFKIKPFKDPLVEDPYGNLVRAESADPGRHPQERVKSTSEDYRTGALRPEPVGDETFLSDDDPVSADDL